MHSYFKLVTRVIIPGASYLEKPQKHILNESNNEGLN